MAIIYLSVWSSQGTRNQSKCTGNSKGWYKLICTQTFDRQYKRRSRDETGSACEYALTSLRSTLLIVLNNHTMQEALFLHLIIVQWLYLNSFRCCFLKIRQPPTFPQGRPCSILGRIRLNHRVRDGYGCFPYPHRHRNIEYLTSSLLRV